MLKMNQLCKAEGRQSVRRSFKVTQFPWLKSGGVSISLRNKEVEVF